MADPRENARHKSRSTRSAWAPRALAVFSCALALLVAQPATGEAPQSARHRTVNVRGGAGSEDLIREARAPRAPAADASIKARTRGEVIFSSAPRLHILATVEILQRLLAAELRPIERPLSPLVWFDGACIGTVAAPLTILQSVRSPQALWTLPPPSSERAFAIAHHLLAPPLS